MRCNVNNQHASSLKNTSNQLHGMFCIKVQRKKLGISAEANEYCLSSNWARFTLQTCSKKGQNSAQNIKRIPTSCPKKSPLRLLLIRYCIAIRYLEIFNQQF